MINKINDLKKFFVNTKYEEYIKEAIFLYKHKKYVAANLVLDKLPTKEKLLADLLETLKTKSVFKSLKEVNEGKSSLKAVASLCTHIAIEIEKGNLEYRYLLPNVMEKINEEVFKLLK